jgi:hypothetical protein
MMPFKQKFKIRKGRKKMMPFKQKFKIRKGRILPKKWGYFPYEVI